MAINIHDRFKDAPWFGKRDIIIGGSGGIGSWLALLLSRMDYRLYMYDHDLVEEHNIGGQLFSTSQVGLNKVEAIRSTCAAYSNNYEIHNLGKYEEGSMTGDIVFSAFDNMEARKHMFNNWKAAQLAKTTEHREANPKEVNVFIDGRLTAETGIIYIVDSTKDIKRYQSEFFDDSKVAEAMCTFRATSHSAAHIASLMVAVLTNKIANKVEPHPMRDVPFKIEFELPMLMHNVIME